jgi:uroporphyrinogen-III decarboxylase
MPESFKSKVRQRVRKIKDALGDDGILGLWIPPGPFANISLLINHEELYTLFLIDPEYYEKLMDFVLKRSRDYAHAMDEAGADVLVVGGGNVAGGFLGRKHYDKYILPFEKKYMDDVQKKGTPALYHNCGLLMNLLESYKELGCRMVESFSPDPLGDGDLSKAKEIVNGSYVMVGGIDQVNVLQCGTVEDVKRATEKAIRIGKPGGKFILQSADFLEYGTPLENLEAYVKAAFDNAGY